MREPNLYLVGAPKSGTSSVAARLRAHPEVFSPRFTEQNHHGTDLRYRVRRSAEAYAAAYEGWGDERYAIDGTVFLLLSRTAAAEIRARRADARIIAVLRNPLDALRSLHAQLLQSGDEDEPDLRRALALAPLRAAGERIPPLADHPHALQYLDVVDYEPQVRRFLEAFGAERVHVELFDDLLADPAAFAARLLAFLELDDDGGGAVGHRNPAARVRSPALRSVVRQPPAPVRRVARSVLRTPAARRAVRRSVRGVVRRVNNVPIELPPLDPELRDELRPVVLPGIDALEGLLGRDLSTWRER